jgi:hypothetical protein
MQVQELQGNVRVFVRCRSEPLCGAEEYLHFPSRTELLYTDGKTHMTYDFDRTFAPASYGGCNCDFFTPIHTIYVPSFFRLQVAGGGV